MATDNPVDHGVIATSGTLAWVASSISVVTAYLHSIDLTALSMGTIAIATCVSSAIGIFINKAGPPFIKFMTDWNEARNKSLAGIVDELKSELASKSRKEAAVEELNEVQAEAIASLKDQLNDVRVRLEAALDKNRQIGEQILKRTDDANDKGHKLNNDLNTIGLKQELLLKQTDAIVHKAEDIEKAVSEKTEGKPA